MPVKRRKSDLKLSQTKNSRFSAAVQSCANKVQPTRFRARIYPSLGKPRLKNPTSSFRKRKTAVLGCFSVCSLTRLRLVQSWKASGY